MRHRGLLAAFCLAASVLAVPTTAAASPVASDGNPAGSARKVEGDCVTYVSGYTAKGRNVNREVREGAMVKERTFWKLPFGQPTAASYAGASQTKRVVRTYYRVTGPDKRPRIVTIKYVKSTKKTTVENVQKLINRRFDPIVFAGSPAPEVYARLDSSLYRYTTYRRPSGRLYYLDQFSLGFLYVDSLAFYGRLKNTAGKLSDFLVATDSEGRLLRIVVPVKNPDKTKVEVLASRGYEGIDELSLGSCEGRGAYAMSFVAIDTDADTALYAEIKNVRTGGKRSVSEATAVTGADSWPFDAVS